MYTYLKDLPASVVVVVGSLLVLLAKQLLDPLATWLVDVLKQSFSEKKTLSVAQMDDRQRFLETAISDRDKAIVRADKLASEVDLWQEKHRLSELEVEKRKLDIEKAVLEQEKLKLKHELSIRDERDACRIAVGSQKEEFERLRQEQSFLHAKEKQQLISESDFEIRTLQQKIEAGKFRYSVDYIMSIPMDQLRKLVKMREDQEGGVYNVPKKIESKTAQILQIDIGEADSEKEIEEDKT